MGKGVEQIQNVALMIKRKHTELKEVNTKNKTDLNKQDWPSHTPFECQEEKASINKPNVKKN